MRERWLMARHSVSEGASTQPRFFSLPRNVVAEDGRKCWKYVLADRLGVSDDRRMDHTRSLRPDPRSPRQIAILVYPGVQSLDFTGPLEVFAGAQRLIEQSGRRERGYEIKLLSVDGRPLETSSGLTVTPHASLAAAPEAIDTLIVAGGYGRKQAAADRALLEWIAADFRDRRRTASVCTGAFLLAAAGVLDGRRATTHWASAGELAARYPAVDVDPEPIFLRDGPIWTSAGVTAGMDLALALVEEDLDRDAALTDRAPSRAVPAPSRQPVAVQRDAVRPRTGARAAARGPAPCRRASGGRSVRRGARRPRLYEPASLRPRVRGRVRGDARALRRAGATRGGSPASGGHRGADRGRCACLRLRHRGDDAPHVPARARRRTGGVSPPLLCPDRIEKETVQ